MVRRIIFLIIVSFIICPATGFCAFDITATPFEGGFELRFGKVGSKRINREVVISVTTTIGKQYRVIQTLLDPLVNNKGDRIPQNNFVVYGIRGTNNQGTLLESQIPVSSSRRIIYTSNQQGVADSFTIVYGITVDPGQTPGFYRGKIIYSLEPVDSTQSPVRKVLNVLLEVAEEESRIEIKTTSGRKTILLNPTKDKEKIVDVLVSIEGNYARTYKIIQLLTQGLISSEGIELALDKVNYAVLEARKGSGSPGLQPLSLRKETVYTSSSQGEGEEFIISYSLNDMDKEKVGRYRSQIKYFLEVAGSAPRFIDTLSLEVENPPVFDLRITPEMGGRIEFRDLKPMEEPRRSKVEVAIDSNLERVYQVSQNIISELTSKEGKVIPEKHFTLKTESLDTKGVLKYPSHTAIREGEMVLFISDDEGSSDSFMIIYQLSIPLNLKPGDYSTRIVYSISEI